MRKIEKEMIAAIAAGKNFSKGNTLVDYVEDTMRIWLHGNLIATKRNGQMKFTLAGWNTPTTRSRLNALGARVYTKKGQAYANGFAIESNQWFDQNGMAL